MIGSQGGSQGGYGILEAELVHGKQVKIPFNDIHRLSFPAFLTGPVHPVQGPALVVYRRFRTVQVFGQRIIHHAAAKSYCLVLTVENGKDDPVSKPIVVSLPFLAGNDQTGLQGHLDRLSP